MHQAGVIAASREYPRDDILLADVALGDVLDGDTRGRRQ